MKKIITLCFALLPMLAGAESLTVGTIERPPFAFENETGESAGFSIDLVREIAVREGFEVSFRKETVFADMLAHVEAQEVDLAAANISVTSAREEVMDFTQPVYESGLQILIPKDAAGAGILKTIWESGILLFLAGALVALLIMAHLVWFFERNIDNPKHDYFRDDYLGGIWDAFWWAFITVTMGGFENERPHHYIGRVLAVFWVLTSLFFVSALTAQITTALTVAELSSSIESYEDLRGKQVGAAKGTTISRFLDEQNIRYQEFDDFTDVLSALEAGELDAAVGGAAVSQYYAATDGQGKVVTAGEVFAPDDLAFAFPENSPYFERINTALLQLKQDGTYQGIKERYFGE